MCVYTYIIIYIYYMIPITCIYMQNISKYGRAMFKNQTK